MDHNEQHPPASSLPTYPTTEYLSPLIGQLQELNGLTGQYISGIPAYECISYLFTHIQPRHCEGPFEALESSFIQAVTTAILNRATPNGRPRLQPREGQVQAIRRLVFRHGDTILIAWSGYGKTIVLQAASVILQGKIIVQICPLKRLGEDQVRALDDFPGARPLLMIEDTNKRSSVWADLTAGKFTHVIVGLEQAVSEPFVRLLRKPEFNQRLAFVAIDDLHTVYHWKYSWAVYPKLHHIRALIPNGVPWFGCTATLSEEAQEFIMPLAGFRPRGTRAGSLSLIRATVDRPNVTLVVAPLEKGTIRDDRQILVQARYYLLTQAVSLGLTASAAERLIRRYDAETRPDDQKRLFADFAAEDSFCRIVLANATPGMVMEMDIRNVKRVVQFGQPPTGDLAELMQRFGRAVRDGVTQGTAYLFVPYWYFDTLGSDVAESQKPKPSHPRFAVDDETDSSDSSLSSHLTSMSADSVSSASDPDVMEQVVRVDPELGQFISGSPPVWTKKEKEARERLETNSPDIIDFVNASCFRAYALSFLQEPEPVAGLSGMEGAVEVPKERCCNACSHKLDRLPILPPKPFKIKAPKKGSRPWFALAEIEAFAAKQAQRMFSGLGCRMKIPGVVVMPQKVQFQVAHVFEPHIPRDQIEHRVREVVKEVDWDKKADLGPILEGLALEIYDNALQKHNKHLEDQKLASAS
ncbi:P-loop containing nucleoside triphosphate hydrolase protein [Rostrohypoxylon terebratum]|nr:P-loop containing nucleoside triphosphate hydrolase protein [Rostrohypoxylon terebratum]